jgi:hypothetical protein
VTSASPCRHTGEREPYEDDVDRAEGSWPKRSTGDAVTHAIACRSFACSDQLFLRGWQVRALFGRDTYLSWPV